MVIANYLSSIKILWSVNNSLLDKIHTIYDISQQDRTLESLLLLDSEVTRWLSICSQPTTKLQQRLRSICLCLELSGHGVLWFIICGALFLLYLMTSDLSYFTHAINMFIILIADIVAVAPIKLYVKRPRPHFNTGTIILSVSSVDRYAFPSGHASRCVAIATYIWYLPSSRLHPMIWMAWTISCCTWALLVSLSRVLSGRHHVLDVIVGMVAGLIVLQSLRITNWFYYYY